MSTATDKARALRLQVSRCRSEGYDLAADLIEELADQIDPKPEYPDGLYCWKYTGVYASTSYVRREDGYWLDSFGRPDDGLEPPKGCTRLRVLCDDEIALPRSAFGIWQTATHARHRAQSYEAGSATADIWRAYADALDKEQEAQP